MYYFDSFGVGTPLFLEGYVELGSNRRVQQYYESYCGAYCVYMIYPSDRGFKIKSSLNILVNQVKCPGMYNECLCFGCKCKIKVHHGTCLACHEQSSLVYHRRSLFADDDVNVIDYANVNVNDNQGTCFAEVNDNDNTNDHIIVNDGKALAKPFHGWPETHNVNDIANDNDEVEDNDNANDNRGTCFADDNVIFNNNVNDNNNDNKNNNDSDDDVDKFIYLFGEIHQRSKPICHSNCTNINSKNLMGV